METSTPHPAVDHEVGIKNKRAALAEYIDAMESVGRMPTLGVLKEQPVHIAMAYMKVAGSTTKEISESCSIPIQTVYKIASQPWFIKRCKDIAESQGKDLVKATLEGELLPTLQVMIELRDDVKQSGSTRLNSCNSLLDRFLGKPVAHIESKTNLNIHTAADAADQVQHELERIDAELVNRGVKINSGRTN